MARIKPVKLKKGDTIGIAAPSGCFDKNDLEAGIEILKSLGFKVFIPDQIYDKKRYMAGEDIMRAKTLNDLVENPEVQCIFCARGGYGSMRILSLINYDAILKNRKAIVGFSDATALIMAVYLKGLSVFHGPLVTSLKNAHKKTIDALIDALLSDNLSQIHIKDGTVIKPGIGLGTVIGGNLTVLCHLMGTKYQPDFCKKILLIEDIEEPPYKIDRMLTHLKLAGCFDELSGIVVGSFKKCGNKKDIIDIFSDIIKDADFPVLAGFNIGHGRVNLTVPLGILAKIDTYSQSLSYQEPAF